jgi:hypothetical protein
VPLYLPWRPGVPLCQPELQFCRRTKMPGTLLICQQDCTRPGVRNHSKAWSEACPMASATLERYCLALNGLAQQWTCSFKLRLKVHRRSHRLRFPAAGSGSPCRIGPEGTWSSPAQNLRRSRQRTISVIDTRVKCFTTLAQTSKMERFAG